MWVANVMLRGCLASNVSWLNFNTFLSWGVLASNQYCEVYELQGFCFSNHYCEVLCKYVLMTSVVCKTKKF